MASTTPCMTNIATEEASVSKLKDTKLTADGVSHSNPEITDAGSSDSSISLNLPGPLESNVMAALARANTSASPRKGSNQQYEPLEKSASLTVKLNPKQELSRGDLMKLLSCMEAELQARDVVIATLKSERMKNLLHYGKSGINDPILALQRDKIGGRVLGGTSISDTQLRNIEETQLQQLEILITQQRRANQRMRHILREAEKRHTWTVEELEKERKKHEHDTAQGDEVTYHLEVDRSRLKQELDHEGAGRRKAEKELKKALENLEEERGKQKQIVLMLVEERKRLALQYAEERKRSEDLAQILSEEKGRIDFMAEELEEESKKSLQMEAELEKQLAEFDTERQQMRAQLAKREDRIVELDMRVEKLYHECEHYRKQLQEAHNVAMFQQTLSVSPPRLGVSSPRAQPPQVPAKPPALTQGQRLQGTAAHSNVTKAVQLTATANSVPVAGPTTGIARSIQSTGTTSRPSLFSAQSSDISRTITTTAKTYSEGDSSWITNTSEMDSVRTSVSDQARVQVSPRVNVSASPGSKVITTTHGGKVTLHVTTNPGSPSPVNPSSLSLNGGLSGAGSSGTSKKPLPPARSSTTGGTLPPVPLNKPLNVPPVPPNKPIIPPKKALVESSPISVEVKPQKMGTQTVKFGITISKTGGAAASGGPKDHSSGGSISPALDSSGSRAAQVEDPQLHESLSPELESFHQLLSSMAGSTDIENPVDGSSSNSIISTISSENHSVVTSKEDTTSSSNGTPVISNSVDNVPLDKRSDQESTCNVIKPLFLDMGIGEPDGNEPPHSPLDVASPLTEDGMAALHLAAQGNNWESVPTLIQCGSSIYAEDVNGRTPTYVALVNGCVDAAKTLLPYMESLEQVTKDGSNLLHGAVRSGCEQTVKLFVQHVASLDSGPSILHLLASSVDHGNQTPVQYALTSSEILKVLSESSLDLAALLAFDTHSYHETNSRTMELLSQTEKEALKCPVWLQGASVLSGTEEAPRWAIGCITLCPSTTWQEAEKQVTSLLLHHWQNICRDVEDDHLQADINCAEKPDEECPLESPLDLTVDSVEFINIGSYFWKMGLQDNDRTPHALMRDSRATNSSDVIIHLKPLEAVAYTCLIPASLLQRYLRLLDVSKCVIVYGAKDSGKKTLAHGLAALFCGSFSRDSFTKLNMQTAAFDSAIGAIQRCLQDGSVLLLEAIPQDFWSILSEALKSNSSGRRGGRILITSDSWRRPADQWGYGVIQIQLRHDREPLSNFLMRWAARHMMSAGAGRLPTVSSQWFKTVKWIADSYKALNDLLMSLGFSTVLSGPHLFAQHLRHTYNARDSLVKMNEVWWERVAPAICKEVDSAWTIEQESGKDLRSDKKKISAMALHVIQERTFLCDLPPCSKFYPQSIVRASEPQRTIRPSELRLQPSDSPKGNPTLPLSPEWTPDNLSKILGLAPMGYL